MFTFYMLPVMTAMFVAMENGIYIAGGYQFCMWLILVASMFFDVAKVFRKR